MKATLVVCAALAAAVSVIAAVRQRSRLPARS
jgi:hypothetical protein